jgi:hypothetical protein
VGVPDKRFLAADRLADNTGGASGGRRAYVDVPAKAMFTIFLIGPQIGPWANTAIATIICAGLAYFSWNLIEWPILLWKPRRRNSESEAATAPAVG